MSCCSETFEIGKRTGQVRLPAAPPLLPAHWPFQRSMESNGMIGSTTSVTIYEGSGAVYQSQSTKVNSASLPECGEAKTSESGHSSYFTLCTYVPHSLNCTLQESFQFQLIPHFIYTLLSEQI